ncbi:MAG: hypothetical protein ACYSWU_24040, partial [Planctomycetota bacterium]
MAEQKVGIIVEAVDKASATLGKIGSIGKKALSGLSGSVSALPDQLGKASTALLLLQNSTSQMGGAAADAVNKIVSLASVAATGGPAGIAIAGITTAIAGWSKIQEVANASTVLLEKAQKRLAEEVKNLKEEVKKEADALRDLDEQYKNLGKTSDEVLIEKAKAAIIVAESRLESLILEERQLKAVARATGDSNKTIAAEIEAKRLSILAAKTARFEAEEALKTQRAVIKATHEQEEADRKREKARKDAIDQRKKDHEALLEMMEEELRIAREMAELERQSLLDIEEKKAEDDKRLRGEQIERDEADHERRREMVGEQLAFSQEAADAEAAARGKMIDDLKAKEDKADADRKQSAAEMESLHKQVGATFASSMGAAFAQVALGAKDADEAVRDAVIQSAETAIMSYAASSAAASAFSQA